jgi:hypothetical protein
MEREWLQVLVDESLKRQYKARAAQNRENMTTVTEALMRLYISGEVDVLLAEEKPQLETAAA